MDSRPSPSALHPILITLQLGHACLFLSITHSLGLECPRTLVQGLGSYYQLTRLIYLSEILSIYYLRILLSKTTHHFLFGFRYQLLAYVTACYLSVCPPNGRFGLLSASAADTVSPCGIRYLSLSLSWPRPPQNSSQARAISLEQNALLYNWSAEQCNR